MPSRLRATSYQTCSASENAHTKTHLVFFPPFLVGIFRGCAPSFFPLAEGCRVELESVLVRSGSSQRAAPRVELCFCNNDKCNFHDSMEGFTSATANGTTITSASNITCTLIYVLLTNFFLILHRVK